MMMSRQSSTFAQRPRSHGCQAKTVEDIDANEKLVFRPFLNCCAALFIAKLLLINHNNKSKRPHTVTVFLFYTDVFANSPFSAAHNP